VHQPEPRSERTRRVDAIASQRSNCVRTRNYGQARKLCKPANFAESSSKRTTGSRSAHHTERKHDVFTASPLSLHTVTGLSHLVDTSLEAHNARGRLIDAGQCFLQHGAVGAREPSVMSGPGKACIWFAASKRRTQWRRHHTRTRLLRLQGRWRHAKYRLIAQPHAAPIPRSTPAQSITMQRQQQRDRAPGLLHYGS